MKKIALLILFSINIIVMAQVGAERNLTGAANPEELVTLSPTMTFNQVIPILNRVSQKIANKRIISTVSIETPISIEINRVPYKKALDMICNLLDLIYDETEDAIYIKRRIPDLPAGEARTIDEKIYAPVDAREIKISAVFFEADYEKSKEVGIDWKLVLSKNNLKLGFDLRTQAKQAEQQQQILPPRWDFNYENTGLDFGDYVGDITALFRLFEANNMGEIIASPSIVVRDKMTGKIQIGSDFSVKQRDFAGNTIERFYSAGSIIEVSPYYYKKDDIDYILLKISVERSTFFPSELTTEIKKTQAISDILLVNGEETVIGGLYVNEETVVRNGIPILKDLPWWVFGIRYLTGSDQKVIRKKELVILIKAELLPTLKERAIYIKSRDALREQLERNKEEENQKRQRLFLKQN
jgi:type IV pilus assembly protein PilQ